MLYSFTDVLTPNSEEWNYKCFFMKAYIYIYMCVCVCVCVCARARAFIYKQSNLDFSTILQLQELQKEKKINCPFLFFLFC
jgi:hypothetical protein